MKILLDAAQQLYPSIPARIKAGEIDDPISPEQCNIIESIAGGLLVVLLLSIIAVGLKGGLPGARKIIAVN
jgi:hypothetical protein